MRRAAALVPLLFAAGVAHGQTCPAAGNAPVTLAGIDEGLEPRLADGRRLRLIGLDPASRTPSDPDLGETSRAALASMTTGKPLLARLVTDKPDRWGRFPAMVFVVGDPAPGGLAGRAIAAGLGRYRLESAAQACRKALLAAEAQARSARLGLWHDPYYGVLAVDDRRAFAERSATTVMVEGRLWRVDAGPFRTKLRFAAPGEAKKELLVAVVLPKVVKRFEEAGVHFEALIGRTMRLRGLLDLRFGPQVELAEPDALELVPNAPAVAGGTEAP